MRTSFFADIQHPIIAQGYDVGLGLASCNFQVDVFANRDAIRAAINKCFIKNGEWSGAKQAADFDAGEVGDIRSWPELSFRA